MKDLAPFDRLRATEVAPTSRPYMAQQRLSASAHAQADAVVGAAVVQHGDVVAPGFGEALFEAFAGGLAGAGKYPPALALQAMGNGMANAGGTAGNQDGFHDELLYK